MHMYLCMFFMGDLCGSALKVLIRLNVNCFRFYFKNF